MKNVHRTVGAVPFVMHPLIQGASDATVKMLLVGLLVVLGVSGPVAWAEEERFPSFAPENGPPADWDGRVFELSQDYPTENPQDSDLPWESISFFDAPKDYLRAVLNYAVEGNDSPEVDWDVARNPIRKWYHAPWLHPGSYGREFIRGLTRERTSRDGELYPGVEECFDNWAVGIYNAPGGYTLGQVWLTADGEPDPSLSVFPVGTVAFKLLFTTATPDKVPFLNNSLEWEANVSQVNTHDPCRSARDPRANQTVRLLQIDVAVRDARKNRTTGWVFGTFIYSAAAAGETVWDRMVPVGLTWTNDSSVTSQMTTEGAFINEDLHDTILNSEVIDEPTDPAAARMMHVGIGGRLNGPVDNPISSCMSCHGRGSWPDQPMVPSRSEASRPSDYTDVLFKEYFAAIPHGAEQFELADGTLATRTDYSLQVAVGIRKFYQAQLSPAATLMVDFPARAGRPAETGPEPDEQEPQTRRWLAWMILLAVVLVIAIVWLLRRKA